MRCTAWVPALRCHASQPSYFTLNDLEQVFKVITTTHEYYDVQYAWRKTRARKCATHLVDLLKPADSVKTPTWSLLLAQVCFVKALISHVTLTWDIHLLSDFKRHLHRTTTTTTCYEVLTLQTANCRWLRGKNSGRTSVIDQWTFAVLRSTCGWRVTTNVGKPSAVGQPTRPTQPFILSG